MITTNIKRAGSFDMEDSGHDALFPIKPYISIADDMGDRYNIIHLWLTRDIGDAYFYDEWFQACEKASAQDLIIIHINSYGGNLDTAIQIYGSLVASDAMVIVSIEGACCSGASMVAMAGDHFSMNPFGYMMIHSWSGGTGGKFNNVVENAEFQKKWFSNLMFKIYQDFCTKAEIEAILNGKDLWMDAQEVSERFTKILEGRKKAAEKAEEKMKSLRDKVDKILEPKGLKIQDLV